MPSIPKMVTLTNSAPDVLNAIRNAASVDYRNYVPYATSDADSIRKIGAVIMDRPALQNEFIQALYNRIAMVIVRSKSWQNPWARFKKGFIEFGETIEEVFVELAKPFTYDASVSETEWLKRVMPDIRSTFHIRNYQKFYKITTQRKDLQKAFLSMDGVVDLVTKIIQSMYEAMYYDEFQVMKYMVARSILDGLMTPIDVADGTTEADLKSLITTIKATSNDMEFKNTKYTLTHVHTQAQKSEQNIIISAQYDALIDVNVLASAFNMSKAEFMGKRVLIDSFGSLDNERLAMLFEDDSNYVEVTDEEKEALDAIPCILIDDDWFQIYDNLLELRDFENPQGLYWNYYLHSWKTFSISPFANNVLFVPGSSGVTSVTVTPSTATLAAGSSLQLSVEVVTTGYAPQTVVWSVSDEENASIDARGVVTISEDAEDDTEITVTATSAYDGTVTGTAVITVG